MSIHDKVNATNAEVAKLREEVAALRKKVDEKEPKPRPPAASNQATGAKGGDGKA